jgi:hypothetical protein
MTKTLLLVLLIAGVSMGLESSDEPTKASTPSQGGLRENKVTVDKAKFDASLRQIVIAAMEGTEFRSIRQQDTGTIGLPGFDPCDVIEDFNLHPFRGQDIRLFVPLRADFQR